MKINNLVNLLFDYPSFLNFQIKINNYNFRFKLKIIILYYEKIIFIYKNILYKFKKN